MIRTISIILLVLLPSLIYGMKTSAPFHTIKPELPDSLKGLKITLEISSQKLHINGSVKEVCFLSANLINKSPIPIRVSISYYFQEKQITKKIEIAAKQQKIFLLDKRLLTPAENQDAKVIYSQVKIDFPGTLMPLSSALTVKEDSR